MASSNQVFDYVIVGAGSAGCVLANRLTEDRSVSVLLLEAGPVDSNDAIRVPALFSALFGTDVDWAYEIEQQPHFHGSTFYPRGRTLGGSSSINLMVYIRGARSDFDGWSARGCAGWDYDSVLPYFVKAEHNSRLTGPLHGTDGPLYVEDRLFTHELGLAWIESAADWGLPHNDDFNGVSQIGSGAMARVSAFRKRLQFMCWEMLCRCRAPPGTWTRADACLRPLKHRWCTPGPLIRATGA
jgi:choline dehydrogenase